MDIGRISSCTGLAAVVGGDGGRCEMAEMVEMLAQRVLEARSGGQVHGQASRCPRGARDAEKNGIDAAKRG